MCPFDAARFFVAMGLPATAVGQGPARAGSATLAQRAIRGGPPPQEAWPIVDPFIKQMRLPEEAGQRLRHHCTNRTIIAAATMLRV